MVWLGAPGSKFLTRPQSVRVIVKGSLGGGSASMFTHVDLRFVGLGTSALHGLLAGGFIQVLDTWASPYFLCQFFFFPPQRRVTSSSPHSREWEAFLETAYHRQVPILEQCVYGNSAILFQC